MTKESASSSVSQCEIAAWLLTGLFLIFVLQFSLLPALLAGLLIFELVRMITPLIAQKFPSKKPSNRSKFWAVGILVFTLVGLLTLAGGALATFLRSDSGSLPALLAKMAQILEDSRRILPAWMIKHLPADAIALKEQASAWLRVHADDLQGVGQEAGRVTVHILIGLIIGGILAVRESVASQDLKPFARALSCRGELFGDAFRCVVFAQLRISAINTTLTGIYLAIILPLMGIHLPLIKTMIAITFLVGLIPVVGNLISNTVIVVVSLSQSLIVAMVSLSYLVVIHKFEYYLNARIIGGKIRANTWEILITMVCLEAAFGIAGVIAAPIYYAYIKSELREKNLV